MHVRRLHSVHLTPLVNFQHEDSMKQLQRKVNQYNLLNTIGEGASCKVILIQDSSTRKYFAAKIFKANKRLNSNSPLPLEREVRIMKKIKHENIVRLKEVLYAPQKNSFYMVMEWGNCGSLQNVIDKQIKLSEKTISSIFKQLVDGISYLHSQGFVHQDIKPSNVLLFSDGIAKIGDFGIGHSFQSAETVVGSPAYQAPEIFDDRIDETGKLPQFDPAKEDVWSLGITLFQVIFGELPFTGDTVYEINRDIRQRGLILPHPLSQQLNNLLVGMLNPNAAERLSMKEISESSFFKDAPDRFVPPINPVDPPKPNVSLPVYQINASICDDSFQFSNRGLRTISSSWDNIINHKSIS